MNTTLEATAAAAEQAHRGANIVHQPEYLVLDEVVRLLRFDVTAPKRARAAAWNYLRRHAVPVLHRGRTLLVERRVLEALLRGV